jgi:hypothetical protein
MNWVTYFVHASVCLGIALAGMVSANLTWLGVPYAVWLVARRDFKYIPAIAVLFVNSGFHIYAIFAAILFIVSKDYLADKKHPELKTQFFWCAIPVIFALFMVIQGYLLLGRLEHVGILADFWSVSCLFCFLYGRIIHKTITQRSMLQLVASGSIVLICQFLTLTGALSYIRLTFFFGPLAVAVTMYGLTRAKGDFLVFGLVGSVIFAVFMGKTYDTLTLLGMSFAGAVLAGWYGLFGRLKISKATVLIVYLIMFMGVAYAIRGVDTVYASHDNGKDMTFSKLLLQDRKLFLERLRMKAFDDRGRVWSGAWENITRPPWFLGSVFEREIEMQLDNGRYAEIGFGAHNLFLHNIVQYRWIAGLVTNYLFIWMMVQSSQVLRIYKLPDGLAAIAITVLAAGTFGANTGTFPMLPMFGWLFLVFAGVCAGVAHAAASQGIVDYRLLGIPANGVSRSRLNQYARFGR